MSRKRKPRADEKRELSRGAVLREEDTAPDWRGECEVCGSSPVLPVTGMCGPCSFGEAETAGGNW